MVLALAASATPAAAAEWYARNGLSQTVDYDDNIGLSTRKRQRTSAFSETTTVDLNLGGRSPTTQIDVASKLNFTRFPTEDRLDSNDQYLTASAGYTGERAAVALRGRFVRDTTRTSDVDGTGLFILQNTRRQLWSVGPEFAYRLTPRDQIKTSALYTDIGYPSGNIRDYTQTTGRVGWTRALSERTQFLADASISRINSNSRGAQNSYIFGLLAGLRHVFSPQLEATVVAGPSLARTDFRANVNGTQLPERRTELGYIMDASVSYVLKERLSLTGGVARTVTPSTTTGAIEEATSFRMAANYTLYPNVFADAAILYLLQEDVGQAPVSSRRDYVAVEPGLRWRFAPDWELALKYRFQYQAFDKGETEAKANGVMMSVSYRLPPWTMSR